MPESFCGDKDEYPWNPLTRSNKPKDMETIDLNRFEELWKKSMEAHYSRSPDVFIVNLETYKHLKDKTIIDCDCVWHLICSYK